MPLIFAVDSDKRQSTQLASLLRSHVKADLVQSATVLDGIDLLQGRIPDLILTSSLLSPRDESALANHMRELGARAAHVHTLTIPVLAAARKASKKRPTGVLGALRREKGADNEAAGCEPEVFAKEVEIYLGQGVEERGGTEPEAAPVDPPSLETVSIEQHAEALYAEPVYAEPEYTEPADVEPAAIAEPEAADSDAVAPIALEEAVDRGPGSLYLDRPEVIAHDALLAQPPAVVADAFAPPEARVPVVDMSTFDDLDALAAQLAAPSGTAIAAAPALDPFEQFFVPQPSGIVEAARDERLAGTIELLSLDETPDNVVEDVDEVEVEVETAPMPVATVASDTWFDRMTAIVHSEAPAKPEAPQAPEPVFSWIDNQTVSSLSEVLSRARASNPDAHEPTPTRRPAAVVEEAPAPVVPMAAVAAVEAMEVVEVEAPREITVVARPEVVVDLVLPPAAPFLDPDVLAMFGAAAHRAGLDALQSLSKPRPIDGDSAIPMPPLPSPERLRVARESKAERRSRRKPPRPAQDEWGMYDPNQCGPAALFDEDSWNEVDPDEKTPARRPRAS